MTLVRSSTQMARGFVAVLIGAQVACLSVPSTRSVDKSVASLSPQIRATWMSQREVVVKALTGQEVTGDALESAAQFFERVTHIRAHLNMTFVGPMPGRELASDLRDWDAWVSRNNACLYWDEEHQTVECQWIVDGA